MEVILDNTVINVIINRKKNKNIYFRFDNDLNLIVNVSPYISEKEIKKLILKNEKALINLKNKSVKKAIFDEEFWYLGNKYNIVYQDLSDIIFEEGTIYVKDEKTLMKFIENKTKEIFTRETASLREIIKTPDFTLKFRKMKTRWGVCNYKLKTITLNTELIKYRLDLLRYVIIHEMCHFYHHNHSKEFWNMVSIYYPEYKKARKELRN
ncbi:MAG: M48 family metallopeptidase [Ruminococcus sp.]|nr:M48 family metallopeptidase [Ruminococcus sp.]